MSAAEFRGLERDVGGEPAPVFTIPRFVEEKCNFAAQLALVRSNFVT
jgi:hypothetical protein